MKSVQSKNLEEKNKKDWQIKLDEVKELSNSIENMKEKIDTKALEYAKLKEENEQLRKVSEEMDSIDSNQKLRAIVQEREKTIKQDLVSSVKLQLK